MFLKSDNASLGIITKTNHTAQILYDQLANDYDIQLITPESTTFVNGVSVTSIQMSKGLEFDEVIISDADRKTYYTEYDRNLLYIACTRAMHRLTLIYKGVVSDLIAKEAQIMEL